MTSSEIEGKMVTVIGYGTIAAVVPNCGFARRCWLRRGTLDVTDGILDMSQGLEPARLNWGRLSIRTLGGMELISFSTGR